MQDAFAGRYSIGRYSLRVKLRLRRSLWWLQSSPGSQYLHRRTKGHTSISAVNEHLYVSNCPPLFATLNAEKASGHFNFAPPNSFWVTELLYWASVKRTSINSPLFLRGDPCQNSFRVQWGLVTAARFPFCRKWSLSFLFGRESGRMNEKVFQAADGVAVLLLAAIPIARFPGRRRSVMYSTLTSLRKLHRFRNGTVPFYMTNNVYFNTCKKLCQKGLWKETFRKWIGPNNFCTQVILSPNPYPVNGVQFQT